MKRRILSLNFVVLICFFFLGSLTTVYGSSNVLYNSAPNPVGSGARAMGMGGAFIAIADDATAASWNPGGLAQLKRPEFSIVGSYTNRREDFEITSGTDTARDSRISKFDLNYLSVVFPFSLMDRNMVIALNYQRLYDYSMENKYFTQYNEMVSRKTEGNLAPVGIAYGIQITPQIKWGITFNFWDQIGDSNKITETYYGVGEWDSISASKTHYFKGFNFNTGLLCQFSEKISMGVVFKSPFTADIEAETATSVTDNMFGLLYSESFKTDKELDMPMSYGLGVQYKISDIFKVSADIYRTNWENYIYKDKNDEDGDGIVNYSGVTGLPEKDSKVDDTTQVRAGLEYLIVNPVKSRTYPLRFGAFYDPIPDIGKPVDAFGFSFGSGLSMRKFSLDGFYQYKFATNESSQKVDEATVPKKVYEHLVYISIIYYL